MGRRSNTGREDRGEGMVDKARGRIKEASGALTGDKVKKSEGRPDQRKGTMKEKKGHLKDLLNSSYAKAWGGDKLTLME